MQIKNPIWYSKKPCPCCDQGFPSFCICTNCNYISLNCDETMSMYINPRNLDLGFTEICPNCKKVNSVDFVIANSEQLVNAGFTIDDYQ